MESLRLRPESILQARGVSTGALARSLSWKQAVDMACRRGSDAIELAAISTSEWPSLLVFLSSSPSLPFTFVSVHAPTKGRRASDDVLGDELATLPDFVDVIVQHPDVIDDLGPYQVLGRRLVIENMDPRKLKGRTVAELAPLFEEADIAFCFDVAHAAAVDPSMKEAHALLDAFGHALSHVHISSLTPSGRHRPLTRRDSERFAPVLRRCARRPWIFEA